MSKSNSGDLSRNSADRSWDVGDTTTNESNPDKTPMSLSVSKNANDGQHLIATFWNFVSDFIVYPNKSRIADIVTAQSL